MQGKIIIIGCGSIGRRHAMNLHRLGISDLLLFDVSDARAEKLAGDVNGRCVDALECAYRERPGAAVICTPTIRHLNDALQALDHDCHLFIEKPLSDSMDGVERLTDEARRRGKCLMAGYSFRFDSLVREIREALTEERIGRVTSARFHSGAYLPWRHPWEDYQLGYGARRELGGGVILDAVHELDLALWFFGRPHAIYCFGGKFSELEINVEDCVDIVLSYPRGAVSIHLDYIQQPAGRVFELIGTHGQIRADFFSRELCIFDGQTRQWLLSAGVGALDDMYILEMRHFIDCIENNSVPEINGLAAAESLLLAEAAKESMRIGLPVQFEEFARSRRPASSLAHA